MILIESMWYFYLFTFTLHFCSHFSGSVSLLSLTPRLILERRSRRHHINCLSVEFSNPIFKNLNSTYRFYVFIFLVFYSGQNNSIVWGTVAVCCPSTLPRPYFLRGGRESFNKIQQVDLLTCHRRETCIFYEQPARKRLNFAFARYLYS